MSAEILQRLLGVHARRRSDRTFRYGVSTAGDCARKSVYAARGTSGTSDGPARWNLAMVLGTAVGEWIEGLAEDYEWLRVQVPVLVCESPHIRGTADVVGDDFVADLKFVGTSKWRAIQKAPDPGHWQQVHTYAAALGKARAALWYLRNDPKGEEISYLVWDEPTELHHAANVIAAWSAVDAAIKAGTLPDRAHPFTDSIECKTCPFRTTCQETP